MGDAGLELVKSVGSPDTIIAMLASIAGVMRR